MRQNGESIKVNRNIRKMCGWLKTILCTALLVLMTHSWLSAQTIVIAIDKNKTAQTLENMGASGVWYSEGIGKYWPDSIKDKMAELLFSKAFSKKGQPNGIGLSAWRFNIGGGTAEQGDSSGISNPVKRVECFLSADGRYNWNKQEGYLWFVKKAKEYGVENLIAFSNTPPVQFTKNGLGFKTEKDYTANLREDKYKEYADFLATFLQHFDEQGLHFNYISPVNEPQWDWSGEFGKMNQEGSPWQNKDIYKIAAATDSALTAKHLTTKIILPEAGILTALYKGSGMSSRQLQSLFSKDSVFFLGRLSNLKNVIEGHSYFTDAGDSSIVSVRQQVNDSCKKYKVPFWQSEYCMLGDGYKEGKQGNIPAIDCALFLAKIIHNDLTVADATAWHFWNSWEPGSAQENTRYYLLALETNADNTKGNFTATKNLWALGHYSRFIRPGMKRILINRSDSLTDIKAAQDVMVSAFTGYKQIVVVAINYTGVQRSIDLKSLSSFKKSRQYITTADKDENMKAYRVSSLKNISLPPKSISTLVIDL